MHCWDCPYQRKFNRFLVVVTRHRRRGRSTPQFHLVRPGETLDERRKTALEMHRAITGREATEEEIAELDGQIEQHQTAETS